MLSLKTRSLANLCAEANFLINNLFGFHIVEGLLGLGVEGVRGLGSWEVEVGS